MPIEMKASELRKLSREELLNKLREARLELMRLRAKKALRLLDKPAAIRNTRRLIARILTVLKERRGG